MEQIEAKVIVMRGAASERPLPNKGHGMKQEQNYAKPERCRCLITNLFEREKFRHWELNAWREGVVQTL